MVCRYNLFLGDKKMDVLANINPNQCYVIDVMNEGNCAVQECVTYNSYEGCYQAIIFSPSM
jgi:hypothetical protein